MSFNQNEFAKLSSFVNLECERRLKAYEAQPRDALEHSETENEVLSGGYAYRQLFELVQNAADAILESGEHFGRIHISLRRDKLEAANTGAPLDEGGIIALLNARSSSKRGNQIGRFGIGFKSLLKLGGRVDITSRSVGLRFDPELCRRRIRIHLGLTAEAPAPGMRLAEVLDPKAPDSLLDPKRSFSWATTVVSANISDEKIFERLCQELAEFPAEFLLFLPVNASLRLDVEGAEPRIITKKIERGIATISFGDEATRWKLFEKKVVIQDEEAMSDATHIQARGEVPLSWAVPLSGREQAGRFWAFFPTETNSLTTGILNAPWKLNSDRTNLIRGPWNETIMTEAAELIATSLPQLSTPEDYGGPLSAFPRQADRQDEIAVPLAKALWTRLVGSDVLPNANGEMCKVSALTRHYFEDFDVCSRWVDIAPFNARQHFLHSDCYKTKVRISRLNALNNEAGRQGLANAEKASLDEWLEAIAEQNIIQAKSVLSFLGELQENRVKLNFHQTPDSRIVLSSGATLVAPTKAIVAFGQKAPSGFHAVHPDIADDPYCRKILTEHLDVKVLSEDTWDEILEASLQAAEEDQGPKSWGSFWRNLSDAPPRAKSSYLLSVSKPRLKFRTLSGDWVPGIRLLVGEDYDDTADEFVLDQAYYQTLSIELPEAWLTEFPVGVERVVSSADELKGYMRWVSPAFDKVCREKVGSVPQYLPGVQGYRLSLPAGWLLLSTLPPGPAARLTMKVVSWLFSEESLVSPVTIVHPTRENYYPKVTAPHPLWFWIAKHGLVDVGGLFVPFEAIDPELADLFVMVGIPGFELVSAYFRQRNWETEIGEDLQWPQSELTDSSKKTLWENVLLEVAEKKSGFADLSALWDLAGEDGMIPKILPTSDGPKELSQIYVTTDAALGHDLDDGRIVLLSRSTAEKWVNAGAQSLESGPIHRWKAVVSEPAHLLDLFPELAGAPQVSDKLSRLSAIWVDGLESHLGPNVTQSTIAMDPDGAVLLDHTRFKKVEWAEGIKLLLHFLARHRFLPQGGELEELIEELLDRRSEEARERVRLQSTLSGRLLQAVGATAEPLLSILTTATQHAVDGDTDPQKIAELALAVHGPSVLSKLRYELDAQGLAPPKRWGGEPARNFVIDLGFPIEFASASGRKRDSEISVSGPIHLPDLHDYQNEILDGVDDLLSSGLGRRRAVISLPTGGGKTRVAAEAVVRLVLKGEGRRSVLWVAQTDELCEQAVQCFRQLWVNVGEPGEDLRIIRLWGGQKNPVQPEEDDATVVVASIQTLSSRSGRSELEWVKQTGVIVIDECHHAIASSYTGLLRWLDIQVGTERAREAETPVLGLSATPWRGYDEVESERLASRFDRRWLPPNQAELYDKLSNMGVLSSRSYVPLQYDRPVTLSEHEQQHVDTFGELPDSVVERMGEDADRNELILDAVLGSSAQSILLFANSVAHAQYLAARLHLAGCSAAAVSGETDRLARQHFTRGFRDGSLRVICNHSVLTTGFDAPKADMILISRPVFSPVLYMQMVGRGLRGPLNGGTVHCEIKTVEDNIVSFRDRLAYQFCRRYFDE